MSSRAWQHRDPALFDRTKEELAAAYPDLRLEVREGIVHVIGPFRLFDEGAEVDRYAMHARLPADFPRGVPTVYETERRVRRVADHHCYSNGALCLFAPGERWRYWPLGEGLVEFLRGPVQAFFVGHAIFELTENWPFGERSHGTLGVVEAYSDLVGTTEIPALTRYLAVLARPKLEAHRACPCGSGRRISECHRAAVVALREKVWWKDAHQALLQLFYRDPALSRASAMKRLRRGVERGG